MRSILIVFVLGMMMLASYRQRRRLSQRRVVRVMGVVFLDGEHVARKQEGTFDR